MTTELEQEFFKVFGVEPKMLCNCEFKNLYDYRIAYGSDVCDYTESKIKEPCKVCKKAKQKIPYYPEITDRKLLEMICILSQRKMTESEFYKIKTSSTKILKSYILEDCIDFLRYMNELEKQDFKHQIQQLFKEGK